MGVCGLPPFGFEGSSPGSCPGCQFGRRGVTSTVLNVPVRVCRRLKMGSGGILETSGSERIEGDVPLPVEASCEVEWPASRSKLT